MKRSTKKQVTIMEIAPKNTTRGLKKVKSDKVKPKFILYGNKDKAISIGRHEKNTCCVGRGSKRVSRKHCVIRWDGVSNSFALKVLGPNGIKYFGKTYHNGDIIDLTEGSIIDCVGIKILFNGIKKLQPKETAPSTFSPFSPQTTSSLENNSTPAEEVVKNLFTENEPSTFFDIIEKPLESSHDQSSLDNKKELLFESENNLQATPNQSPNVKQFNKPNVSEDSKKTTKKQYVPDKKQNPVLYFNDSKKTTKRQYTTNKKQTQGLDSDDSKDAVNKDSVSSTFEVKEQVFDTPEETNPSETTEVFSIPNLYNFPLSTQSTPIIKKGKFKTEDQSIDSQASGRRKAHTRTPSLASTSSNPNHLCMETALPEDELFIDLVLQTFAGMDKRTPISISDLHSELSKIYNEPTFTQSFLKDRLNKFPMFTEIPGIGPIPTHRLDGVYYYSPEKDWNSNRRLDVGTLIRKPRGCTLSSKQYYFKPPPKLPKYSGSKQRKN